MVKEKSSTHYSTHYSIHYINGSQYIIREGKVYDQKNRLGVVYSPGGGAGLVSWSTDNILPSDYRLIFGILFGLRMSQIRIVFEHLDLCVGGWKNARIAWIPANLTYEIGDNDGNEYLILTV